VATTNDLKNGMTLDIEGQLWTVDTEAIVAVNEGNPLYIELAASVPLKITYTEPGIQGDRSSGGTKPATVETGIEIQVPLFIKQDEIVLVDTRDGSYQGRAN